MNIPKNFEYIIQNNPNFIKSKVTCHTGIIAYLPACYADREVYVYYPDHYIERKVAKLRHNSTVVIPIPAIYKREFVMIRPVKAFTEHDMLKMRKLLFGAPMPKITNKHVYEDSRKETAYHRRQRSSHP